MSKFYGDGGTIHSTGHVDVETHNGKVTAVWFRCQTLKFKQTEVDEQRATEMERSYETTPPEIRGFRLKYTDS